MAARRARDRSTPVRITTAPPSRADDISARQRRYLLSMGVRTVCVVAAVLVGPTWYRWVLMAGAVFIPYVAVVLANVVNVRDDGFALMDESGARGELAAGPNAVDTP